MNTEPSALWKAPLPADIRPQLEQLFSATAPWEEPVEIFFRADDIGTIDHNFIPLMELFSRSAIPLCPALVPNWLSPAAWETIQSLTAASDNFCWHQHGYAHVNHTVSGKKNEFGDNRSPEEIQSDISRGRTRLTAIIGKAFFPVFTPPWNRCSGATMEILQQEGFAALSRSLHVHPSPPEGLKDIMINIDLHTRREETPAEGMSNLLGECRRALDSGRMGFMIHHQRMNETAFLFLEHLFAVLDSTPRIKLCTFRDLLPEG